MANGSSPQANLDLVTRMYACFNADDMETIRREIFAPDLVWNLPGHHPLSGTKNGSEEVLQFFLALRRANIRVTLDPASDPATGIDTFGDSTVVEVHRGQGEFTVNDAGGGQTTYRLNALNCTHYHVANGRIDRVQVYISDQHTVDQFFNAVYQLKPIPDRLAS
jgi:ketosteroid isomerase-like protein